MSDLYVILGGAVPAAGAALLLLRKYGRIVWANRKRIEQVVEIAMGEGTTLTTTTRSNDPDDLVPAGPDTFTAFAAAVSEQMEQMRAHSRFQDERMDSMEQRLEARDNRIEVLEKELERLREENRKLRGQNQTLKGKIRELEAEIARLKTP